MSDNKLDLLGTTNSDIRLLQEKGYYLQKIVGEGSYAKVYKAVHMWNETQHTVVACKLIDTAQGPREYLCKFLPRELDVLIRVDHPHIVNVSSIFQRRAKYFIFLRYAEKGDLLDFITQNGALSENQSRLWMRQIMSGLYYIHTLNIAHRDLKCENILITANYNVKITDFGFTRTTKEKDRDIFSETYCGSLLYAAPEVLKGVPYLPKCADMWSIGIILYIMLNKALPFNESSARAIYEKQIRGKWRFRSSIVDSLSLQCREQVAQLMEPEPQARPTAGGMFNGPWIGMDTRLTKLTPLEENLLKQANEEMQKQNNDESEYDRIALIRQKYRGKGGLRVLKEADENFAKSQQLLENTPEN
ncbi:hypothetical protein EVAR_33992_1 [Eumeta japonica]|uniref:Protein kinase domain-containing protein n=1 Tax=Eumeta variegata TaxID=151549 RepID=A0A4C1X3V8_EUMVA|nr:hypothetical protein EVAR_33992_1 [Eumeta japonica]